MKKWILLNCVDAFCFSNLTCSCHVWHASTIFQQFYLQYSKIWHILAKCGKHEERIVESCQPFSCCMLPPVALAPRQLSWEVQQERSLWQQGLVPSRFQKAAAWQQNHHESSIFCNYGPWWIMMDLSWQFMTYHDHSWQMISEKIRRFQKHLHEGSCGIMEWYWFFKNICKIFGLLLGSLKMVVSCCLNSGVNALGHGLAWFPEIAPNWRTKSLGRY